MIKRLTTTGIVVSVLGFASACGGGSGSTSSSSSAGSGSAGSTGASTSGSSMSSSSNGSGGTTSAGTASGSGSGSGGSGGSGMVTFDQVHPIYMAKCSPCHAGMSFGNQNIAQTDVNMAYMDSQKDSVICPGDTVGACTLVRIQNGSMPFMANCTGDPTMDASNAACTTQDQQDLIKAWIDGGQLPPA